MISNTKAREKATENKSSSFRIFGAPQGQSPREPTHNSSFPVIFCRLCFGMFSKLFCSAVETASEAESVQNHHVTLRHLCHWVVSLVPGKQARCSAFVACALSGRCGETLLHGCAHLRWVPAGRIPPSYAWRDSPLEAW